jgi:hypothetical protein
LFVITRVSTESFLLPPVHGRLWLRKPAELGPADWLRCTDMTAHGTTRKHFCIALNPSALAGRGDALDDSSGVYFKPALDPN